MLVLLWIWPLAYTAAARVMIADFSSGTLAGWKHKSLKGHTHYKLVNLDGRKVLRARCEASASTLIKKHEVDLTKTPVLHWSWRVDRTYKHLNEQTRDGDDFPGRVSVILSGGMLIWRTRSISYVWAGTEPVGAHWRNPFAEDQVAMLVLRSGTSRQPSRWLSESRNVRRDFKRLFNRDIESIDAVSVATDCDNSDNEGEAWYGNLYFTAE